jgi:hypothetical protein
MIKLKKKYQIKRKILEDGIKKKNSFIVYMNSDRVKILPQFL